MRGKTLMLLALLTLAPAALAADTPDVIRLLAVQKTEIALLEERIAKIETRIEKLEQLSDSLNASKLDLQTWTDFKAGGCQCSVH